MNDLLGVLVGLGLAAACGFRVFVPLLVINLAARAGHLHLADSFAWMASDVALMAFATATILEIAAYYVPWLDNLLDAITSPAAVVAGCLVTAATLGDLSPFLRWALAIIAGGGLAGMVQAGTVSLRGTATATTGGLANALVATGELAGSLATSWLAVAMPVVCAAVIALVLYWMVRVVRRRRAGAAGTAGFRGNSPD